MATLNGRGNIAARCRGCKGAMSTYEWQTAHGKFGNFIASQGTQLRMKDGRHGNLFACLFRCAGCGLGGFAHVIVDSTEYPGNYKELVAFHDEVSEKLNLPTAVPPGIKSEFQEAENCLGDGYLRAAAGLFRSVLDKTLRANGYKLKSGTNLEQQIDLAANDGVITESRRRRAHDEVRVLGNDVLHDEWRAIPFEDVSAAHHYVQRILEDFYDDRPSTLKVLRGKQRIPDEDKQAQDGAP